MDAAAILAEAPTARGLDRRPRQADPAAAAAARADRTVGGAALFRPWQSGTDRCRAPQAEAAAQISPQRGGIAAVVTSPLQRARHAAEAAKALGLDVTVDDDLIETDFGEWEGLTFAEAAERDPELHRTWLRDTCIPPPDGESFDRCATGCSASVTG